MMEGEESGKGSAVGCVRFEAMSDCIVIESSTPKNSAIVAGKKVVLSSTFLSGSALTQIKQHSLSARLHTHAFDVA